MPSLEWDLAAPGPPCSPSLFVVHLQTFFLPQPMLFKQYHLWAVSFSYIYLNRLGAILDRPITKPCFKLGQLLLITDHQIKLDLLQDPQNRLQWPPPPLSVCFLSGPPAINLNVCNQSGPKSSFAADNKTTRKHHITDILGQSQGRVTDTLSLLSVSNAPEEPRPKSP